ncbi:hypothetical protein [Catalinimonas niigatensis]|uniref:hypothetical protein n=1 Tax=Catalinimonas niigatensis TaxID=1397264 RepID=UPI002666498B|nr:hypothetical protein [Catalinimonas niigatensis]WPP49466.1 hypothetical protein PZB72_22610 [Catalinimonas niigatensis]
MEPQEIFGWTGKIMGTFAIHKWRFEAEKDRMRVYVEERKYGRLFSVNGQKKFSKTADFRYGKKFTGTET